MSDENQTEEEPLSPLTLVDVKRCMSALAKRWRLSGVRSQDLHRLVRMAHLSGRALERRAIGQDFTTRAEIQENAAIGVESTMHVLKDEMKISYE